MKKFLYWTPRILSILLACFISVFALDVFSEGYSTAELAIALLMHLLPTIITIIFIVIAWKHERVGGWLFTALGIAFLFIGGFELVAILTFSLPLFIIGGMYLSSYYTVKKPDTRQG